MLWYVISSFLFLVVFHHVSLRNLHARQRKYSAQIGGFPQRIELNDHRKRERTKGNAKGNPKYEEVGEDHAFLHVQYTPVETNSELPVVVFESQMGMSIHSWSVMVRRLSGVLPTVVYERQGFGLSSPLSSSVTARDLYDYAQNLYSLLYELGLVSPSPTEECRKIILVGHSFGGILVRAFQCIYKPENVIGVVVLDPPPVSLVSTYPEHAPFLNTRLPTAFATASSLADFGLLRLLDLILGIKMMPLPKSLLSKLTPQEINALVGWSYGSRTLNTMAAEVRGYVDCLETLKRLENGEEEIPIATIEKENSAVNRKHKTKVSSFPEAEKKPLYGNAALIVIMGKEVEKPMINVKISFEEWKDWWIKEQKKIVELQSESEILKDFSKCFLVDSDLEHPALCASDRIVEALFTICEKNGFPMEAVEID